MRIAMWSSWFIDLSPEEMVETFVREGWDCTELSSEHARALLDRGHAVKEGESFREFAEGQGLDMPQGHLELKVDIVQPDPAERAAMMDNMKRWCDLFMALGIKAGVLHAGGRVAREAGWEADRIFDANVAALNEFGTFLKGGPTRIALENAGGHGIGGLLKLCEAVNETELGICLDTGHLNIVRRHTNAEFMRAAGERLIALHIADNRGERDDHAFPFGPQCTVDWTGFGAVLEELGYGGLFNYEVPGESSWRGAPEGGPRKAPLPVRIAKLAYARRLAEFLLSDAPAP